MSEQPPETICLTVPGWHGSGPGHWQTTWEVEREDCVRVDLGDWEMPVRTAWISRIDRAVLAARQPVVIAAHSLGCLATVWWAKLSEPTVTARVRGALLVAPPDVERPSLHPALRRFAPEPRAPLPFPSFLVASRNDQYTSFMRQREMAAQWGSRLVDVGELGHINAASGIGDWLEGQLLLNELIRGEREHVVRTGPYPAAATSR